MKTKWLCTALCTLCVAAAAAAEDARLTNPALNPVTLKTPETHAPIELVRNGELNFVVYVDEKKPNSGNAKRAASILREAFWHCTGKIAPLIKEKKALEANKLPVFYIGETDFTASQGVDFEKINKQGFVLKTIPGVGTNVPGIVIAGKTTGVKFGVLDFVERYLGCRFFMPTEWGSVYPKCTNLSVNPAHYRDEPYVINREQGWFIATAFGYANKLRWEKYFGKDYQKPLTGIPEEFGRVPSESERMHEVFRTGTALRYRAVHNPHAPALVKAFPDKIGEYFYKSPAGKLYAPEANGGNGIPVLNVTNLEFADAIVDEWVELIKNKKSKLWGTQQTQETNEEFVTFGQCDADIPLIDLRDHPVFKACGSTYPNLYGRFHKHLAQKLKEKLPGTKLSLMAYASYNRPPDMEEFRNWPDNVELQICTGNIPGMIRNPDVAKRWKDRIVEWEKVLGHPVGAAWFYGIPNNFFARAVAPEYTAESIRSLGFGRTEVFYDFYGDFEWCYYYSAYVMYRGMWNPNFNVNAALDEHWNLFYGPKAGPELKAFHDCLVRCFEKYVVPTENYDVLYPVEELEIMKKHLENAEKALDPDSVEMKRFRVFAEPWMNAIHGQIARINFKVPEYALHSVKDDDIVLDGNPLEDAWSKASVMDVCHPNGYPVKPTDAVAFKALWGAKGVYVSCRMNYVPNVDEKKGLWQNDNLEIFLSPGEKIMDYYQFALDVKNEQWYGSKKVAPIAAPFMKQPSTFKSAVHIGADFWSAEAFIPYSAIQIDPAKEGDVWHGNFVRTRLKPAEYHGSTMTNGNNHNYPQYGILKFQK